MSQEDRGRRVRGSLACRVALAAARLCERACLCATRPSARRLDGVRRAAGALDDLLDRLYARRCRVCGCEDARACPDGCGWVEGEGDVCTACAAE